jgi:hypothetical protein
MAPIAAPAEFGVILDRHFDQAHGYIRKRVGESPADDLASQVFLIAFDRRDAGGDRRARSCSRRRARRRRPDLEASHPPPIGSSGER